MLTCTRINADGEYEEADDGNDLDTGEPELELSVEADGHEINEGDHHPEDSDEDADRELGRPILDDESCCSQLQGESNGPREPVDPSHSEAQAGVYKSVGVGGKCSRNRNIRRHLAQGGHDRVHDAPNKDIGNKSSRGPRLGDGSSAPNEETCSDGSTCNI